MTNAGPPQMTQPDHGRPPPPRPPATDDPAYRPGRRGRVDDAGAALTIAAPRFYNRILRPKWRDVFALTGLFCFVIAGFLMSPIVGFAVAGAVLIVVPMFDTVAAPLIARYVERALANDDDES